MRSGRDHREAIHSTLNFDFEAFFLEFEFGKFRALHQIDDLFNLFKVQANALVELSRRVNAFFRACVQKNFKLSKQPSICLPTAFV